MVVTSNVDVGNGKNQKEIWGKSTETKPTVANENPIAKDMADSSMWISYDTRQADFYNATTDTWV